MKNNDDEAGEEFPGDADASRAEAGSGTVSASRSPLLSAAEAAEILCVSRATLWELVKRDRLPCVEFIASGFRRPIRRYRLDDLHRFIDDAVR